MSKPASASDAGGPARPSAFTTETVWNAGLVGTGATRDGQSLTVGHHGEWTPEHLLLLAVESCFMSALLTATSAAGVTILGYVSSGHLEVPVDLQQAPSVSLSPCIVVATEGDAERVAACARQAEAASAVVRLLGGRVQIVVDVRVAPDDGG